jgi:hypothetical protein
MLDSRGEVAMALDPAEAMQRRLSRRRATSWGFSIEEAGRLAFWKWLAVQRGETRRREQPQPQPAHLSWRYELRVDD